MIKLRGGAVEYGRIYEQKIAALLSIRCALDPTILDFWMVSNVDDFGAFDDIVFSIQTSDGSKKTCCIQLKHVENRALQASQLESDKGNFRLKKYQESYQSIKKNIKKIDILKDVDLDDIDFILYTNAPLSAKDNTVTIKLEHKDKFELISTTSKINNIFQVTNLNTPKPFDVSFLQRFFLYTNQASATDLDRLIKNEFDSHFEDISNTVIITITDYFLKWAIGKKSKGRRISKKDVQMKLVELLLQPHVIEPKPSVSKDSIVLGLLNDTLIRFNVTPIVDKRSLENIFSSVNYSLKVACGIDMGPNISWNANLTDKHYKILKTNITEQKRVVNDILKEKKNFVAHITIKDLYISAWQSNLVPLLINCDLSQNSVQEILFKFNEVTRNLSFVLLSSSGTRYVNFKGNLKIFNTFNDIDDPLLVNRNLTNTFVSLQGKAAVSFEEFKTNVKVLEEITPDIYIFLLNGVLKLGETYEIENYYIKRTLQRPRISLDVLNESNVLKERYPRSERYKGDLFLLVQYDKHDYILHKYRTYMVDLVVYINNLISGTVDQTKYIITTELSSSDKNIDELIGPLQQRTEKVIHVVKLLNSSLEWLISKGPIDILHDYLEDSTSFEGGLVEEDNILTQFKSDINIISNNAGMGKTFMLTSLANKFDSNKWVCLVNLSEHMPKISKIEPNEYVDYVRDYQVGIGKEIVRKLSTAIYQDRWDTNSVIWLLDGYDEVSSEEALSFLKQIQALNLKVWITTRPTYRRDLEGLLDVLSLQITHFKEEDHVSFLWKYFETFSNIYGYNKQQIQYIINTINKCSTSLDKTFIAIPLQTRMFAEIFGDDIDQITDKEKLTIVDLYNKFIDIKLKEYKSYEATSLKKTLSKLALKLFFTDDQLEDLLDFEELAEEALTFQESYRKDSIVIGLNEKGDAVFGHRTFAEFLAAHWLTKQIITKKGRSNPSWVPLVDKLFYVDMISVRIFFDGILCQNLPLHSAVLNSDLDQVHFLLSKDYTKTVDTLGRSPLHLAVSYGNYYDFYASSHIKGLKAVGLHTVIREDATGYKVEVPLIKTQLQVPTEIIEALLDHGFGNVSDTLFDHDAFDYALKSCSLEALNCLYRRFDKEVLLFQTEFNFKVFLYCVVYDNLYNILSSRRYYDFNSIPDHHELRKIFAGYNSRLLTKKYNDMYLTEVSAYRGGIETLLELLLTRKLKVEDGLPVHKACFNGHSDIVDLLYKMGADIEKRDRERWSPLYQAGKRGRSDIAYQFLSDIRYLESKNDTAMTPMHYATQGGHLECTKALTKYGASFTTKDNYDNTPLYYGSLYGHLDVVEYMINNSSVELKTDQAVQSVLNVAASKGYSLVKLIKCGLNVNNVDHNGDTPLILASKNGFPKVIEELAQAHCDLDLMKINESLGGVLKWAQLHHIDFSVKLVLFGTKRECGGLTSLHFSILHNHLECVKTLIQLGANKRLEDTIGLGYSPLIWAGIKGNDKILEALLTPTLSRLEIDLEDAEMSLIWASILGFETCVNILLAYLGNCNIETPRNKERIETILKLEYGTDYNMITRPFGDVQNVPLVLAAINNRISVILLLVLLKYKSNQADLNVALLWATKKGYLDCVKVLVELGAEENVKNEKHFRVLPIVWASMSGHVDIVRFFLRDKPEEYAKHEDVALALNFATMGGHFECVKLLLDFGVDINNFYADLNGTPLLNACESYGNSDRIIIELLSRKCDVNAKNSAGETALELLARKKKFDFVKVLISMGAHSGSKVDVGSGLYKDLQVALDWAIAQDDLEMIYRLAQLGICRKD